MTRPALIRFIDQLDERREGKPADAAIQKQHEIIAQQRKEASHDDA
jgi:hypothetical protein